MAVAVPRFTLPELSQWNALQNAGATEYTLSTVEPGAALQDFPFRAAFYGIGLCRQGSVELRANLEQHLVLPDSLLVLEPDVMRTWQRQSADYHTRALFFTEAFFWQGSPTATLGGRFAFLQHSRRRVVPLPAEAAAAIWQLLEAVRHVLASSSSRKSFMVCSYAHILVDMVADCYEQYAASSAPASPHLPELVQRFKQLVSVHYLQRRRVGEYADLLCVTPKHLSETVKAATGQAASQWLAAMLTLEAQVQLRQTTRSLGQIAEALCFSDVSAFGKFFRRQTGLTPAAYRHRAQG